MSTDCSTAKSGQSSWNVWKTIHLGTGIKDAYGFRKAIKDAGMRITPWANDILGKAQFTGAPEPTGVDLVTVTVTELGFKDRVILEQVHAAAKERGLALCPSEVGPQLRLQYQDQPKGEELRIGTEPIIDSDSEPSLSSVWHASRCLWLSSGWGGPKSVAYPSSRFVFVLPSK